MPAQGNYSLKNILPNKLNKSKGICNPGSIGDFDAGI